MRGLSEPIVECQTLMTSMKMNSRLFKSGLNLVMVVQQTIQVRIFGLGK